MLGTTLTSCVYLWQTMQQVDERPPDAGLRYRIRECVPASLGTVVIFWSSSPPAPPSAPATKKSPRQSRRHKRSRRSLAAMQPCLRRRAAGLRVGGVAGIDGDHR
jgi:hypothetical protein